jgi:hypothetical protein
MTAKQPLRAPAVALKLETARGVLQDLNREVGQAALEAHENAPGAAKRLAGLRQQIADAEREVSELERAHTYAARADREASASGAVALRAEQFAIMKKHAEIRLKKAAILMEALATASKAFSEYAIETNAMVVALPTGTRMAFLGMGRNGYGGSWIGDLKSLIAAECFRLTVTDERGRGARLPFAQAPELTSNNPGALTPAIELMTEAQETALRDIEGQMNRLNDEQMAAAAAARIEGQAA